MSEYLTERIVIDERELAVALGMSVHFLRKDRCGPRLIPFYRIGGSIRYDMTRVREALIGLELGGNHGRTRNRAKAALATLSPKTC